MILHGRGDAPVLVLPVENQVRELDAKLLFAAVAAEHGYRVVLGSQSHVLLGMADLPPAVYVAKSMRAVNDETLAFIRWLGHAVVAWDEESLVRFQSPEYYAWRYSQRSFGRIAQLFAWGRDDAEYFASYSGYCGAPIHATGNPRLDLLRHELRGCFDAEVAALRARFGRFVLINTNFSFVNNHLASLNLVQCDARGRRRYLSRSGRGLSLEFGIGMAAHQQAIWEAFRALIERLSRAFPHTTFVLRPHPSENDGHWRADLASFDNVVVAREGSVVPWLLAADGLLHNGCTTAVEATLLGVPAVSYQPVRAPHYDYHLPNGLSHAAFSVDEVMGHTSNLIAGRCAVRDGPAERALLARHVTATDGALACERILEALAAEGLAEPTVRPSRLTRLGGQLGMRGRAFLQRMKMRHAGHRHSAVHHAHHFPEISADALNARVAMFTRAVGSGRFDGVRAAALSRHVFVIAREGA